MNSPELRYPHEGLRDMAMVSGLIEPEVAESLVAFGALGAISKAGELSVVSTDIPFRWSTERQFELFTGHRVGAELCDKRRFSDVIRSLGYLAPRSVVYTPKTDDVEMAESIRALDLQDPRRFLKPVSGSRAKGTMYATDLAESLTFARMQGRPYLIQEVQDTKYEVRYALHRDPVAVQENAPHNWRLAFRKLRPSLEGDGVRTLSELVRSNQHMPIHSRLKHRLHSGYDGNRVPSLGEHVELATGGNIGAELVEDEELYNLDQFMHELTSKLEHKLGRTLATVCFDVGVKRADGLAGVYNHERLKNELVLYEFQVPFGYFGYTFAAPKPEKIPGFLYRGALFNAIMHSLLASAQTVRRLS